MVLDYILRQINLPKNSTVLDLCAAPGGKSTLVTSYLDNEGLLVSNEIISSRSKILRENISKWGYANNVVTNNAPADFERIPNFFDAIVIDAPCSGEGMFRKDPAARDEWSLANVDMCAARQQDIVTDIWDSLKQNGYIIYSTCTFNSKENENNIKWILEQYDARLIELPVPKGFHAGRENIGFYGLPGRSQTEGFYIAVIQKLEASRGKAKLAKKQTLTPYKDDKELAKIIDPTGWSFFQFNERILGAPTHLVDQLFLLQNNLHIVLWGTTIGEIGRKGIIVDHHLAMSHTLSNSLPKVEVDEHTALHYLKGETPKLPTETPIGTVAITYQGQSLGWIKNMGNRYNNLFPKEYRIRMALD
jgi:tRNA and rRNA cytosine-C5-methylases